jgi:hypothetical protein
MVDKIMDKKLSNDLIKKLYKSLGVVKDGAGSFGKSIADGADWTKGFFTAEGGGERSLMLEGSVLLASFIANSDRSGVRKIIGNGLEWDNPLLVTTMRLASVMLTVGGIIRSADKDDDHNKRLEFWLKDATSAAFIDVPNYIASNIYHHIGAVNDYDVEQLAKKNEKAMVENLGVQIEEFLKQDGLPKNLKSAMEELLKSHKNKIPLSLST